MTDSFYGQQGTYPFYTQQKILIIFRIHNRVNKILGKSEFPEDVQAIKKRWKVGWRDAAPQRLVDSNTYGKFCKSSMKYLISGKLPAEFRCTNKCI